MGNVSNINDSIKPVTRIVAGLIIIILLLAFIALYIYPGYTATDFAWTIVPGTTAMLIGEGYLAGAVFFVRVITEKRWHRLQAGFLPITVFTIIMLAATLLHLARFHQGTFLFYFWTVIYAVTPLLVPWLWWYNGGSRADSPEANDITFAPFWRRILALGGLAGLLFGLGGFIWPGLYIATTPWQLTELTARIFSGWTMLASATVITASQAGRWSAVRLLLQSVIVGQALTLLALPRMWPDFLPGDLRTDVFVGGLIIASIGFVCLYFWLDRRSHQLHAAG